MVIKLSKVMLCAIAIILSCAVISSPAFGNEVPQRNAYHEGNSQPIESLLSTVNNREIAASVENVVISAKKPMCEIGKSISSETSSQNKQANTDKNSWTWEGVWAQASKSYLSILFALWGLIIIVQSFMAYGTAFYKTRMGGNNGVALFGWLIVFNMAAIIPFLGVALWTTTKNKARSLEK